MDGRGGCCIARYATSGSAYDASKVDRIMLRFRPIAPKPCSGGSSSGGSSTESKDSYVKTGRGRRRYMRSSSDNNGGNRKRCSRKQRQAAASGNTIKRDVAGYPGDNRPVVTLPLLPEAPELSPPENKVVGTNNNVARGSSSPGVRTAAGSLGTEACFFPQEEVRATWLNFSGHDRAQPPPLLLQPTRKQVEVWLTVECVTETWVDWYALGRTDEERRRSLGEDAWPGFVSDGLGMVTWTNIAFRRTVAGNEESEVEMAVWLVMKDQSVPVTVALLAHAAAFACRVRMQYTSGKEMRSVTVPCDVWRMDGGGFAWRLDVKAALSLGR